MNTYTQENKPKSGKAKRIWEHFHSIGLVLKELHYNPNCWGNNKSGGWGTWACEIDYNKSIDHRPHVDFGWFCGIQDDKCYVQIITAPYTKFTIESLVKKD